MKFLIILISVFLLCGCESQKKADIFAMDTIISLDIYGEKSQEAIDKMKAEIMRIDKKFRPDSSFEKDAEIDILIEKANGISEATDGSFNIYLGEVMSLWGFRDKNYRVPDETEIEAALNEKVLDFGGIAKGYAGDCLKSIAEKYKIKSGILSLGGNVVAIGKRKDGQLWRVGIADPKNPNDFLGYVEVCDKSVVTSGGYQRYFEENGERYHHIINPENGRPAKSGLSSVTVISSDSTLADALSTAFFVSGKDKTLEIYDLGLFEFEAVMIEENGNVVTTKNANFTKTK